VPEMTSSGSEGSPFVANAAGRGETTSSLPSAGVVIGGNPCGAEDRLSLADGNEEASSLKEGR